MLHVKSSPQAMVGLFFVFHCALLEVVAAPMLAGVALRMMCCTCAHTPPRLPSTPTPAICQVGATTSIQHHSTESDFTGTVVIVKT